MIQFVIAIFGAMAFGALFGYLVDRAKAIEDKERPSSTNIKQPLKRDQK